MALHKDFPKSPYAILDPGIRWFPADEALRETSMEKLMPLIMIGQNLQGRHAEAMAESDFDINVKAEMEIETILLRLEQQNELMLKILRHLENESRQPPKD